jgi:histidyl-tRNA synthetase
MLEGSNEQKLETIAEVLKGSETGLRGVEESRYILSFLTSLKNEIQLDLTLARGLSYYTGAIVEVKALDTPMGSISGGGRYDNLTGIFGLPDMSGVGISFGADRIYDVLQGLDKFPAGLKSATTLLFANMGTEEVRYILPVAKALREKGVAVEVYPDSSKLKKQFDYADRKAIPFLSITGGNEMEAGQVNVKNLVSGEQKSFRTSDIQGIIDFLGL